MKRKIVIAPHGEAISQYRWQARVYQIARGSAALPHRGCPLPCRHLPAIWQAGAGDPLKEKLMRGLPHSRTCAALEVVSSSAKILCGLLAMTVLFHSATFAAESSKIRVGHFPNVTHAPALVARATQHFENRFGRGVEIEWKTFNAGPEAIEALFAGAIDILYVGPNPAINGFVRSRGEALRIIAGVASGGAGFVVRPEAGIERFEDIHGKRIASPQKGNSQDVSLHFLMKEKGLLPRTRGGDVEIFHLSGGDQITALLKGQVDGLWTVEPWLTRLVSEAHGKILFEEGELWPVGRYATTVLVASRKFIHDHADLVKKWVAAHAEIIEWIHSNEAQAKKLFNQEFQRETGRALPPGYLDRFFSRIVFTADPMKPQVLQSAERAAAIGYLGKNQTDFSSLFELTFLEKATGGKESEPE